MGDLPAASGATVSLNQNGDIAGLHLSSGARLNTDGQSLNVLGDVTASGDGTQLNLADSPAEYEFEAGNVQLSLNATLDLGGATARVNGALTLVTQGAEVTGAGEFHFAGAGTTLINDGSLRANGGTQQYKQLGAGMFDLDGVIEAGSEIAVENGGTIIFEGQGLSDAYDGVVTLQPHSTLTMNLATPWQSNHAIVASNPHLASGPARIQGSALTISGLLFLDPDTALQIGSDATIESGGFIGLGTDSALDFLADVNWAQASSASFNGGAVVRFHGRAEFADGDLNSGRFEIMPTGHLVVPNDSTMHGVTIDNHGIFEIGEGIAAQALVQYFNNEVDGAFHFDLVATGTGLEQDLLEVHEFVQLDGTLEVILSGSGPHLPEVGDSFIVVYGSSGLGGVFLNNPISYLDGLYYIWDIDYGPNSASLVLSEISTVPEPSTVALAMISAAGAWPLVRAHRRKRAGQKN